MGLKIYENLDKGKPIVRVAKTQIKWVGVGNRICK
jgi:hypothetical protein